MCGVLGVLGTDAKPVAHLEEILQRMGAKLTSRGPDEHGTFVMPGIGLGHRRLSIIDLSGGKQPMSALEGQVVLSYNGEIYNHRELRTTLESSGFRFSTRSDTEVLLNAYLKFGPDFPKYLRGMFAFAIWDARDRSLLLGRDRLGIKPMFYARTGSALVFGSEIKAVLASGLVERTLDLQALDDYFAYGFIRSPRSIYRDIRSLLPGQTLRVRLAADSPSFDLSEYWQIPDAAGSSPPPSFDDAKQELERLLMESVRIRLESEVPLGALLSGGVDSSAVVWAMSRVHDRPIKTFTIGFNERSHDEAPYARAVARHLGTEHHEETVTPSAVASLPEIVRNFDEPFADPSAIPTWYVFKMVRKHVTVCLSGDGGDELLAGYKRYQTLAREWNHPGGLGRHLAKLGRLMPMEGRARNRAERLSMPDFNGYYARFRNNYSPDMRERLLSVDARRQIDTNQTQDLYQRQELSAGADSVTMAQLADLQGYLCDDILVKLDRTSMAHSVEARVPLLDHQLVSFVQSLPVSFKLREGQSKALLVDLIRPHLPQFVLSRAKRGFSVPLAKWFRGELHGRLRAAIEGPTFADRSLFSKGYIQRLFTLHQSGRVDLSFQLWQLLVFDEWWQAQRGAPAVSG